MNSHQSRSQDHSSRYSSDAFVVGLSAVILILAAVILFPRVSRAEADAGHGKELFEKRCTGCHSLDQDKEGPRLRGVYGRKAGKVPGFTYSAPLQSLAITWDDASLDKWLTNTDSLIADNDMTFRVLKPDAHWLTGDRIEAEDLYESTTRIQVVSGRARISAHGCSYPALSISCRYLPERK